MADPIQIRFVGDADAVAELGESAKVALQVEATAKLGQAFAGIRHALDRESIVGLVGDRAALADLATDCVSAREAADVLWHLAPETEA